MNRSIRRNRLYLDPNLKGIIYHTIKFCDYYGFEYASIKRAYQRFRSLRLRLILQARARGSF
ncbi:MAG: 2-hydroxyacyl-CoA dehydratase family protein [Clostridiaceae bacterium]